MDRGVTGGFDRGHVAARALGVWGRAILDSLCIRRGSRRTALAAAERNPQADPDRHDGQERGGG
jgi:hypothetical protein